MNSRKIFFKRYFEDFRFQWDIIFHLVGAPIIFFYSVGLVIFFGSFVMIDIWQNTANYWPADFPLEVFIAILIFLASSGTIRTYLFEADLLYFIQAKKLMANLRLLGFISGAIKGMVQLFLLLGLVFPVLRFSYEFDFWEFGLLLIVLLAYKMLLMSCRKLFKNPVVKWLITGLLFLGVWVIMMKLPLLTAGILGLLVILGVFLIQLKITKSNGRFYREVEIDFMDRHKYFRIMMFLTRVHMVVSPHEAPIRIEKTSTFQSKKPRFLFRNSKRIFKVRSKENGVLEFYLKAFLRNKEDRSMYFRIMMIPNAIVFFFPPLWFKIILFGCFVFVLRSYMQGIFLKIKEHSFFQLVPADEETVYLAMKRFLLWTTLAPIVLMAISWFLPLFL